jgi:hypothetical protein
MAQAAQMELALQSLEENQPPPALPSGPLLLQVSSVSLYYIPSACLLALGYLDVRSNVHCACQLHHTI